jgi:hypothetical protein
MRKKCLAGRRPPSTLFCPKNTADSYCLARSIVLGVEWHKNGNNRAFKALVQDRNGRQTQSALTLLRGAGCRLNKPFYNFSDAQMIHQMLSATYGAKQYRILVIDPGRLNRVVWKSNLSPARYDIVLLLYRRHYMFIGEPRQLFQVKDICFCLKYYIITRKQ